VYELPVVAPDGISMVIPLVSATGVPAVNVAVMTGLAQGPHTTMSSFQVNVPEAVTVAVMLRPSAVPVYAPADALVSAVDPELATHLPV